MDGIGLGAMTLRLVSAILLGGLIGFEREAHERPAGMRTHMLVSFGAALFTLCSYSIAGIYWDPGRISAQIVTGVGFLGAGTIIRQGVAVRGLTTAASIWTVAAIGLACGIGGDMLYIAAISSVLGFATLTLIRRVERYLLLKPGDRFLTVALKKTPDALPQLLSILVRFGIEVRLIGTRQSADGENQIVQVRIRTREDFNENNLGIELASNENVISYNWER